MTLKYLLLGCLVVVGLFAFSKRDFVLDAFDWETAEPGIAVPAFDAVARAQELQHPAPVIEALRIVEAPDTRTAVLAGVPADPLPGPTLQGGTATLAGTVQAAFASGS